jgi:hypothetical protein
VHRELSLEQLGSMELRGNLETSYQSEGCQRGQLSPQSQESLEDASAVLLVTKGVLVLAHGTVGGDESHQKRKRREERRDDEDQALVFGPLQFSLPHVRGDQRQRRKHGDCRENTEQHSHSLVL